MSLIEQKISRKNLFQKGQSGNPAGRAKGVKKISELRNQIAEALPEILQKIIEAAKNGDMTACRLLLDKAIPSVKPQLPPIAIPILEGSLSTKASTVIEACFRGEVSPEQASAILSASHDLSKLKEMEDLEKRLTILEEKTND